MQRLKFMQNSVAEIYAAAKQGEPDPELNTSSFRFFIERAKQAQVPKHVIDKAIDKAKGGGDETFVQGRYEGFGPNWLNDYRRDIDLKC